MKVFARYFHIFSVIISSSTFSYPQPRSACSSAAAAYEKKIKFFYIYFHRWKIVSTISVHVILRAIPIDKQWMFWAMPNVPPPPPPSSLLSSTSSLWRSQSFNDFTGFMRFFFCIVTSSIEMTKVNVTKIFIARPREILHKYSNKHETTNYMMLYFSASILLYIQYTLYPNTGGGAFIQQNIKKSKQK